MASTSRPSQKRKAGESGSPGGEQNDHSSKDPTPKKPRVVSEMAAFVAGPLARILLRNDDDQETLQTFLTMLESCFRCSNVKVIDTAYSRNDSHYGNVLLSDKVFIIQESRETHVSAPLLLAREEEYLKVVRLLQREDRRVKGHRVRIRRCPQNRQDRQRFVDKVNALLKRAVNYDGSAEGGVFPMFVYLPRKEHPSKLLLDAVGETGGDDTDDWRCSPLHRACHQGQTPLVHFLLDRGADVDRRCGQEAPLHLATSGGHLAVVRLLCSRGADPGQPHPRGRFPLAKALLMGQDEIVSCLVQHGADLSAAAWRHSLLDAFSEGHVMMAAFLLGARRGYSCSSSGEAAPLTRAIERGHLELLRFLCEPKPDMPRPDATSALYDACAEGYLQVARCLVDRAADVNSCHGNRGTPLIVASQNGHLPVVDYLCGLRGVEVNKSDDLGRTALHKASLNGHIDVVHRLLKAGADCRAVYGSNISVLHEACFWGHVEVIRALVEAGAEPGGSPADEWTPLLYASRYGHTAAARALCSLGADVNGPSPAGELPMHAACRHGNLALLQSLCEYGGDVRAKDRHGRTPLHVACEQRHAAVIEFLCGAGACVNAADAEGRTCLHAAADTGRPLLTTIACLLRHGGDLNRRDHAGTLALTLLNQDTLERAMWKGLKRLVFDLLEIQERLWFWDADSKVKMLLGWTGVDVGHPQRYQSWSDLAEFGFLLRLLQADHPLLIHEVGEVESALASETFDRFVSEWKSHVPTLQCFSRAVIRSSIRKTGVSFLKAIPTFWGEAPQNVVSYLFLHEEALHEFPNYRRNINSYFQFQPKVSLRNSDQERDQDSEDDTAENRKGSDCGELLKALRPAVSSSITESVRWHMTGMALHCPQACTTGTPASADDDLGGSLAELRHTEARVRIRVCHKDACCESCALGIGAVQQCVKDLLQTFLGSLLDSWSLRGAGSFFNNNKILPFDELDFLAVREIDAKDTTTIQEPVKMILPRYRVSVPAHAQYGIRESTRAFLHTALDLFLRDLERPDDPAGGAVWRRACEPHPRGPGVCAQLAWVCERRHTHHLGVDVSPALQLRDRRLANVWRLPPHFRQPPFDSIRDAVAAMPVLVIQSRDAGLEVIGDHVTSNWEVTLCHIKPLILECLDSLSPNIRVVFRLLKYLREFLPRKLKFSRPTRDIAGSWRSGPVISSYVVYNILLQEVVQHPTPGAWADPLLPARLVSALHALAHWTYLDFHKDLTEQSLNLAFLTKPQRNRFKEMMKADISHLSGAIAIGCENSDAAAAMETQPREYLEKVCVVAFHPNDSQPRYYVCDEGKLRYETKEVRKEIGITETADLYYYHVPTSLTRCNDGGRLYRACVSLLAQKFTKNDFSKAT